MLIGTIFIVKVNWKRKTCPYTGISLNKRNWLKWLPSSYITILILKNIAFAVLHTYAEQTSDAEQTSVLPAAKFYPDVIALKEKKTF